MDRFKRLFYLTVFNILVSASATLAVLYTWDLYQERLGLAGQNNLATQQLALNTTLTAIAMLPTAPVSETSGLPTDMGLLSGTELPTFTPSGPTFTPSPTPRLEAYQVKSGDTLGIIAGAHNLTIEAILAVNDLSNPNNLTIGQIIFLPTGPLPTLTRAVSVTPRWTATISPTPRRTQTPTLTPTASSVETIITIDGVLGAGDLATEKVQITLRNLGVADGGSTGSLSLVGWQLSDRNNNVYKFPQLELFPSGSILINTRSGQDSVNELFWGLSLAAWQPGETVTLSDAQGNIRATYQIP